MTDSPRFIRGVVKPSQSSPSTGPRRGSQAKAGDGPVRVVIIPANDYYSSASSSESQLSRDRGVYCLADM